MLEIVHSPREQNPGTDLSRVTYPKQNDNADNQDY